MENDYPLQVELSLLLRRFGWNPDMEVCKTTTDRRGRLHIRIVTRRLGHD